MDDANTARLRTALPQAWAALIVWTFHRFHLVITDLDTTLLLLLVPIVGAALYDLARRMEARGGPWRIPALLLLGSAKTPTYSPPDPPSPEPPPLA
jgi:hypothetical protein